ncbi:Ig-like domain-containing protein [Thaumasiovibrio subtropicus]|uniref:Ig-like domain-containing protein n=1 Tax=Thaumasiovibrio subtropicus TaxID=1891207 RepID=UPI00131A958A|nr:Ig-like domain-containing protein [Thaumasiovibrio subtropicus]
MISFSRKLIVSLLVVVTFLSTAVMGSELSTRDSVIVIDTGLTDWPQLVEQLEDDAEIILVDQQSDGISQLHKALSAHSNIQSLHLFSHGQQGALLLGNGVIDSQTVREKARFMREIRRSFAEGADLYLYGCDVANGEFGEQFTTELAHALGVNLAASSNKTGAASLGGDWDLEFNLGVDRPEPIQLASYAYVLATDTFDSASNSGNVLTSSVDSISYTINAPGGWWGSQPFDMTGADSNNNIVGSAGVAVQHVDNALQTFSFDSSVDITSLAFGDGAAGTDLGPRQYTFSDTTSGSSNSDVTIFDSEMTLNSSFRTTVVTLNWTNVSSFTVTASYPSSDPTIMYDNLIAATAAPSDSTPPTLSAVTPVPSPTNDSTPNYTFSTDEAGTLSLGGSCGTSTSTTISSTGNQTITLTQTDNSTALSDGSYSDCTVTVTDATGNASSPLSIASFTVDSSAPTLSAVTVVSTPTNDGTPNYVFSTNETGTLSLGGSCGTSTSTTISSTGNQTITLTQTDNSTALSDGSYSDCTVTVTDATGNASSPLSIASFTVDSSAPTLSAVTVVSTPTNDSTPNYVFSTNETGTLSLGGSCGTSTSTTISSTGNQTITLTQTDNSTALSDGSYSDCTVTVTDATGNASSPLSIASFTVDSSAPTLSAVTVVSTPTNDSTPNYVFSTNETGTLAVGGSCGTSTSTTISSTGNQTITLTQTDNSTALSDGTYSDCTVTVTDASGNASSPLSIASFTVDSSAPSLSAVTVVSTPTNDSTPNYVFSTNETGTLSLGGSCGTSASTTISSTGNQTITLTQTDNSTALSDGSYSDCTVTVTDASGNASSPLSIASFTVDSSAPTLSAVTVVSTPTNDSTPNYVFSTNETGTLAVGGSCGTSTSTTISSTGNQTITLTQTDNSTALSDGSYSDCTVTVTDASGNASSPLSIASFTVDSSAPSLSAVTVVSTPTNDSTPNYVFSTNETGTLSLGGSCGTSTSTTISSTGNQTITLTQTDNSTALSDGTYSDCTVTVTDASGNGSSPLSIASFTVDSSAPTLSAVTVVSTPTNDSTPNYVFSTNETGTLAVGGSCGTSTSTTISSTGNQTITLTQTDNSTALSDGSYSDCTVTVTDASGNASSALSIASFTVDSSAPSVSSVSASTSDGTYKVGDVIAVTITFSESVTVSGTPLLILETGATDRSISYGSGSGSATLTFNYTIQAEDQSSDLDYTSTSALVLNSGTIQDAAGNNASLTLASPGASGSLAANKALVIDGTLPTVTQVTSATADGVYKAGDTLAISVSFSESVNVTGTPQLTLETGTTDQTVNYASGTGSATLIFNYIVQAGDTSSDLDYASTAALSLNSGSIVDSAGNAATLTLASPGAANSLGANKAIVIDTTAPSLAEVTAVASPTSNSTPSYVFSSNETGTMALGGSCGSSTTTAISASGNQTITLTQTDNSSAMSDGSYSDCTVSVTDTAGNVSAALNITAFTIDTAGPAVASVSSTTADASYKAGDVVAITVTFNESVVVTGTPQLTLETGSTDRLVDYSSGSGSATLTFNYTVQAGDSASDLDYVSASSLSLNGGSIADDAGNSAALTLANPGAANSLAANKAIVIDTTAPTLSAVTLVSTPTQDSSPDYVFSTSEAGAIALSGRCGTSTSTTLSRSGNHTITLTQTDNSSDLADGNYSDCTLTVTDSAGNASSALSIAAFTVDTAGPTVSSVSSTSSGGAYKAGDVIAITVTFNESVTVTGTPQVTLETGATDRSVAYSSGSGSTVLTFNYTVQDGDTSSDLGYVSTSALLLNGGSIADSAGNGATLTLPAPSASNSLSANKSIVIDTTAPTLFVLGAVSTPSADSTPNYMFSTDEPGTLTFGGSCGSSTSTTVSSAGSQLVTLTQTDNSSALTDGTYNDCTVTLTDAAGNASTALNVAAFDIDTSGPAVTTVSSSTSDGSYKAGDMVVITVTMNESVTVTGTPQLTVETGSTDRIVDYASGSGTATLVFSYTVQAGDTSSDLDYTATNALTLNGGAIVDDAGNAAFLTLATPGATHSLAANKAIVIDTTAPTLNGVTAVVTPNADNTPTYVFSTDEVGSLSIGGSCGTSTSIITSTGNQSVTLTQNDNSTALVDGTYSDCTVTVTDAAGNASSALAIAGFTVDTAAPTVSNVTSATANGTYGAGESISVTVTFNETVVVTGTPQLTLETGTSDRTINYTSGSGSSTLIFSYVIQAGDNSDDLAYTATNALQLNSGTLVDNAGNAATLALPSPGSSGSLSANKALVVDTTAPMLSAVTVVGTPTSDNTPAYVFNVDETGTLAVGGSCGTSTSSTISTTGNHTVTLTQSDNSTSLNDGTYSDCSLTVTDSAGNVSSALSIASFTVDTSTPSVTSVSSTTADGAYKAGDIIAVTVTFNESVNVSGSPLLTLETGTTDQQVAYSSGTGSAVLVFNYTVQTGDESSDLDYAATTALSLNGGSITDAAGNAASLTLAAPNTANSLGANKALVIDTQAPSLAVVTAVTSPSTDNTPDFQFSTDEIGTVVLSGSCGTLTSTAITSTGNQTLTLTQTDNTTALVDGRYSDCTLAVTDAAGNSSASLNIATFTVDTTEPRVTAVSSTTADGAYKAGDVIVVTIDMDEVVNITGTPQLILETGDTDRIIDYVSGSGTSTLTFNYTVQAGDNSDDLSYVASNSFTLNSGTVTDLAGNVATLTLPSPSATDSLSANKAIVVDTMAPTLSVVSAVGSPTSDSSPNYVFNTSEMGTLAVGGRCGTTTSTSISVIGDQTVTLTQADNSTALTDGAYSDCTVTLTDAAGNASEALSIATFVVDTAAPTITEVTSSSNDGTYVAGDVIPVMVSFTESVVVSGTPQIGLETGTVDQLADYDSGSATTTLTFSYTVQAGDNSADLAYIATDSLIRNSGTITDEAGNVAILTLPEPGDANSLSANKAIIVDTDSPTLSVVTAVDTPTSDNMPNFVFSSDEAGTFALGGSCGSSTHSVIGASGHQTVTLTQGDNSSALADGTYSDCTVTVTDAVGNVSAALSIAAFTVDTIAPVLTDVTAVATPTNDNTPNYVFSSSEAGTLAISGSCGTSTNAAVTSVGEQTVTLTQTDNVSPLVDGTYGDCGVTLTDLAGNVSASLSFASFTVDTTGPTVTSVSSTANDGDYKAGEVIGVTVNFDEAVLVTGLPTMTLETGSTDRLATYSAGSNTTTMTFSYTVQAGDSSQDLDYVSTAALALNGGTIKDAAGNAATLTLASPGEANSMAANKAIVIDTLAPTLSLVTEVNSPTAANAPSYTFSTDEVGSFVMAGNCGTSSSTQIANAGNVTVLLTQTDNSSVIAEGSYDNCAITVTDNAGNVSDALAINAFTVDRTAPSVTGVSSTVADGNYNTGDVIAITVNFDEPVSVTGAPSLALETGEIDRSATYSRGSGTATLTFSYSVQAGDVSRDLAYLSRTALSLNGGTLTDAAGNDASLTLLEPGAVGSLSANKAIVIDGIAPMVTMVSSSTADGSYKAGEVIAIDITFNEVISVTGSLILALETGDVDSTAEFISGSGTETLTFNYIVQNGDNSDDLGYVSTEALTLNGGTLTDVSGNVASLALPVLSSLDSLSSNKAIIIDTTSPTVSIANDQSSTAVGDVTYTFSFSEAVTGFTVADVDVDGGTPNGSFAIGSDGESRYTLVVSPDANSTSSLVVNVSDNVVQDMAGNGNSAASTHTQPVDSMAPSLSITADVASLKVSETAIVTFTISEADSNFVLADVDVIGGELSALTTTDNQTFTSRFTPTENSETDATFNVAANAFNDAAGNGNTAATALTIAVDTLAPTVTMGSDKSALKAGETAEVSFELSESSADFVLTDIDIVGGELSALSQVDNRYTATFTPSEEREASATIDVLAAKFTDAAGNENNAAQQLTLAIDTIIPSGHSVVFDQSLINASNEESSSFTFANAEVGASFTYEIRDGENLVVSHTPTTLIASDQQVTALDVSTLNEGTLTLAVVVTDNAGNVADAVLAEVEKRYDAAPVAVDDMFTTDEEALVKFDLLANDTDINQDMVASSALIQTAPTKGSATIANGVVTYQPNLNAVGTDTFTYTVKDATLLESNVATATVTIHAVNDAPVAAALVINTNEDAESDPLDVRSAATDVEDTMPTGELVLTTNPTRGAVVIDQQAGTFVYTPDDNTFGADSFTYTIADSEGKVSNIATVNVNVGAVNDAPIAANDAVSFNEDVATTLAVLSNDSDIEDLAFAGSNITLEDQGSGKGVYAFAVVTVGQDGSLNILPTQDINGQFSFTYTLTDSGQAVSNAATVSVTIAAVNDAPVAVDNAAELQEEGEFEVNVLGNDTDVDSGDRLDTASVTVVTPPTQGQTRLTDSGTIIYTPNADYFGEDSFTYTVADSAGAVSNVATVVMTVTPVNDAPQAIAQAVIVAEDGRLDITLTGSDVEDDALTFAISQTASQGELAQLSANQWRYTPNSDYFGDDVFQFTVNDGQVESVPAAVSVAVTAVNDAPTAADVDAQGNEDEPLSLALLGEDTEGDTLSYRIVDLPEQGQLTLDGANVRYQGETNFFGQDSFTYVANDGELDSETATVSITLSAVNDAPIIAGTPVTEVTEDTLYTFTPSFTDSDTEDNHTYSVTNAPSWARFDTATGTLSGTPSNSDVGDYSGIVISVSDGSESDALSAFTIRVSNVNDAPVIGGTPATTVEEDSLYVFTPTASDVDSSRLSFSINRVPNWAIFDSSTGRLSGTPTNEDVGQYSDLIISVSDGELSASLAAFTISVSNVNDAPTISGIPILQVNQGEHYSFTPSAEDVDSSILTFSIANKPAWLSFDSATGGLSGTPENEDVGTSLLMTIAVSDGVDSASLAAFAITVVNVNDAPVALDDTYEFVQTSNNTYLLDVLANDSDIDEDSLALEWVTSSENASILDDQVQFVAAQVGTYTVQYGIEDGNQGQATATATITIRSAALDAPTITAPADIDVLATGLFTRVELGTAVAFDSLGNALPVKLVDNRANFRPGVNTVYWSTEDSQGNVAQDSQTVNVFPLISLSKDAQSTEGTMHSVSVILNGPSPIYPVVVPYSISGTVDDSDHSLQAGEVVIASGMQAQIEFELYEDTVSEGMETLVIELDRGLNLGSKNTFTLSIYEENVAPQATVSIEQEGEVRTRLEQEDEEVTVALTITDANRQDSHAVEWTSSNDSLSTLLEGQTTAMQLSLDVDDLDVGIYPLSVLVTDNGEPPLSVMKIVYLEVVESLPELSDDDSDGDSIPDDQEGHGDDDEDGIPDYLDAISECNVIPQRVVDSSRFLIEGQPGVCLRKGITVLNNQTGGSELLEVEIEEDENADNIGGIFDFVATGLPQAGQSYQLVMPQRLPVPANAVYRKFRTELGWVDFVEDENNSVASSLGESGYCPPPGDDRWVSGLTEGHWCVQLTVEDGGPNDDDGMANGTVVDPGGVAARATTNTLPTANDDTASVSRNSSVTIDVLSNDVDTDGDALTLSSASTNIGSVSIVDNKLFYEAASQFFGDDTIIYSVTDGNGGTGTAQVGVTVVNSAAPRAIDDRAETDDRQAITIQVLINDSDPDGDRISVVSAVAQSGTVVINSDQSLTYTPTLGFDGEDLVTYVIRDTFGLEDSAQVRVTVERVYEVEVANNSGGSSVGIFGLLLLSMLAAARAPRQGTQWRLLFLLCAVLSTQSQAAWFVEGEVGVSEANGRETSSLATSYTSDNTGTLLSFGVGYQFKPDLGLTLRYIDMGEGSATLRQATASPEVYHQRVSEVSPLLVSGVGLDVGYTLLRYHGWSGALTLGAIRWEADIDSDYQGTHLSTRYKGVDPYLGLGIDYTINEEWQLGVQVSRYFIEHNDVDSAILSLKYTWAD